MTDASVAPNQILLTLKNLQPQSNADESCVLIGPVLFQIVFRWLSDDLCTLYLPKGYVKLYFMYERHTQSTKHAFILKPCVQLDRGKKVHTKHPFYLYMFL